MKQPELTGGAQTVVRKHWAFMQCLAEAAKLHRAIEDVRSDKAQAKLDELLRRLNSGGLL